MFPGAAVARVVGWEALSGEESAGSLGWRKGRAGRRAKLEAAAQTTASCWRAPARNKQRKNHSQCLLWPNSVPGAVVNFGHELFRLLLTTPCEVDRNVISDR